MSAGPSFFEFLLLCMIGLIVLGPKRLPQVANQIGTWVGQARRMTRTLRRQLEEELDLDRAMNIKPPKYTPPRDDDTYSPLHETAVAPPVAASVPEPADGEPEVGDAPAETVGAEAESGSDDVEQRKEA